jgi:ribonuclease HII
MKLGESCGSSRCFPRGCIVGPLVVAGVAVRRPTIEKLRDLGVRDSKQLTPAKREELHEGIMKLASKVGCMHIPPREIDVVVSTGKKLRRLNYLEAVYFAEVIDSLGASKVVVDAADVVPERFRVDIVERLRFNCSVVSKHKADSTDPVVSAASIIAKVERDRAVEELRRLHGDFGTGYPSDEDTIDFLRDWIQRKGSKPNFTRKSWKTWHRIAQLRLQL